MVILLLINVQSMFNIYRMLFLALKNVEIVKFWLLLRFPTSNKKTQKNFPSLLLGGPSPSLNTIWKTLHAVSKVNAMKKKWKRTCKEQMWWKKTPGIFRIFAFLLYLWKFQTKQGFTSGSSTKVVLHPFEILRPKTKTPGSSTWFFFWSPLEISHCF